jgi:hypothetical protein
MCRRSRSRSRMARRRTARSSRSVRVSGWCTRPGVRTAGSGRARGAGARVRARIGGSSTATLGARPPDQGGGLLRVVGPSVPRRYARDGYPSPRAGLCSWHGLSRTLCHRVVTSPAAPGDPHRRTRHRTPSPDRRRRAPHHPRMGRRPDLPRRSDRPRLRDLRPDALTPAFTPAAFRPAAVVLDAGLPERPFEGVPGERRIRAALLLPAVVALARVVEGAAPAGAALRTAPPRVHRIPAARCALRSRYSRCRRAQQA